MKTKSHQDLSRSISPIAQSSISKTLPVRANVERLRKEAKDRLRELRSATPTAQLADAQFILARQYGFASWRELKLAVEKASVAEVLLAVGDWIGALTPETRIALQIRSDRVKSMK